MNNNDIVLLEKLKNIKNVFLELDDVYEKLVVDLKKNFVVDNKMIFEDNFNDIKNTINSIKDDLIEEIIPIVNNRI